MNFKKFLLIGAVSYLAYKAVEIQSHYKCLKRVHSTIGDKLFDDKGEFKYAIGKDSWITFTKRCFEKGE